MLRKSAVAILIGACLAAQANAAILLVWVGPSGFVPNPLDLNTGILENPPNPTLRGLAQLIFTPTDDIDPALAGTGANPNFTSGNDVVLASLVLGVGLPGTTSEYGSFDDQSYTNLTFSPGYAYVRVFERDLGDINVGTRYFDGPTLELKNLDPTTIPPPVPQRLLANKDLLRSFYANDPLIFGDYLDQSVALVPEPSTMGLLAIGAMAAAWRRRRVTR